MGAARTAALPSFRPLVAPGVILLVVVICAIAAPLIAPYDPLAQDIPNRLQAPSAAHLMGTDEFGRDIYSRVIFGARTSVVVGLFAVMISATVGTLSGMAAGYLGGRSDEAIMRVMDVIIAFPGMILAIALVAAAGSSLTNVILVIGFVQLPVFARLARSSALGQLTADYITACHVIGLRPVMIVRRHLLPNSIAPMMTMAGLMLADAILTEAGLSFLGLGVVPPTPTWGNILASGREFMILGTWWFTVFPGVAIFITVLAVNWLTDAARDWLDPRRRSALDASA